MNENQMRNRRRDQDMDPEEIEDMLSDLADAKNNERRDHENEDRHIMKMGEYFDPYGTNSQ